MDIVSPSLERSRQTKVPRESSANGLKGILNKILEKKHQPEQQKLNASNMFDSVRRLNAGVQADILVVRAKKDFSALNIKAGQEYVLKVPKIQGLDPTEAKLFNEVLLNEYNLMKGLKKKHVLPVMGTFLTKETGLRSLLMEYIKPPEGMTFTNALEKAKKERRNIKEPLFPSADLVKMVRFAAESIHYLWDENINHRDIKPDNLFAIRDKDRNIIGVVIADFGMAMRGSEDLFTVLPGTREYSSPEVIKDANKREIIISAKDAEKNPLQAWFEDESQSQVPTISHRPAKREVMMDENNPLYDSFFPQSEESILPDRQVSQNQKQIVAEPLEPELPESDTESKDVYALAVITYELVMGTYLYKDMATLPNPYTPDQLAAVIRGFSVDEAKLEQVLAAKTNREFAREVAPVLTKALSRKPEERYSTCTKFARAFELAVMRSEEAKDQAIEASRISREKFYQKWLSRFNRSKEKSEKEIASQTRGKRYKQLMNDWFSAQNSN